MTFNKNVIILFLLFFYSSSFIVLDAQNKKIDSLLHFLRIHPSANGEAADTSRLNVLNLLAESLYFNNPDTAISLSREAMELSVKLSASSTKDIAIAGKKGEAYAYDNAGIGYYAKGNLPKGLDFFLEALKINNELENSPPAATARWGKHWKAINLQNIGAIYFAQGDYPKALDYFMKALKLNEENGDKNGQAANLGNIGQNYKEQGDYPKALDYFLKALKLNEELGSKIGQAGTLGNIGNIYDDQGDFTKALDYDQKALKMYDELGSKSGQARNLGNIGGIYGKQGAYAKALDYYLKALKINDEFGNKRGQASNLGNIGGIYSNQGYYPKALEYFVKALKLNDEIDNKSRQASNLAEIGGIFTKTGKFKEAEDSLKKAIGIASSINEQNDLRSYEEYLSTLYDTTNRGHLALIWYKKAMKLKDTLFNIDEHKALTRKELTYNFEKQEDSLKAEQDKKDAVTIAEKKKQIVITVLISIVLILALISSVVLFNRFRMTTRQKNIIESQKHLVEEKNKDILDSINYAKRLQDAILPPISLVKKYFPESFVLYKPKDIVAGDFYWMERAGDNILIAAADCTGHGVPGALVSVVCSNALNRTVKEFHITEPGKILDKVRELVLETFEKSEGNIQDGMDVSLCCINTKTLEIQWSGAYNPLWYISNGEIKELEADKQPIGKTDKPKPFNTHSLKLQKGDTLYLFTDGYADQFGGPKSKKFKYKQMQEKLLAISHQSLDEQEQVLEKEFEKWKGALEQTDDVCIMGIRV